jgi:two-component system sensor histidine kinase UhpB
MAAATQQLGMSIENARLSEEAHERERRLSELLRQAVGAQEAERQRIARELHDSTGQSLTAVALGLRGMETMLLADPSAASEQMRELQSFCTGALRELRRIIADLRPSQLDDLGLVAAVDWYVREFEDRSDVSTKLVIKGDPFRLPSEFETVLFRIAQEALTNVARHARAAEASVLLSFEPARVHLTISDNGRGFDPAEMIQRDQLAGWGLIGIQERALLLGGQCEIDSTPGGGTRIRVSVPVAAKEARDGANTTVVGR